MASINKVILIGNLGQNPELKFLTSGQAVANFSIATNKKWQDKEGKQVERTEWHRIVVWGKVAENCAKYLTKGRPVYIEGELQTRSWDDKDGTKRYTTEIQALNVQFLGSGNGGDQQQVPGAPTASVGQQGVQGNGDFTDADIPF